MVTPLLTQAEAEEAGSAFIKFWQVALKERLADIHNLYAPEAQLAIGPNVNSDTPYEVTVGSSKIGQRLASLGHTDLQLGTTAFLPVPGNGVLVSASGLSHGAGGPLREFTQTFVLRVTNCEDGSSRIFIESEILAFHRIAPPPYGVPPHMLYAHTPPPAYVASPTTSPLPHHHTPPLPAIPVTSLPPVSVPSPVHAPLAPPQPKPTAASEHQGEREVREKAREEERSEPAAAPVEAPSSPQGAEPAPAPEPTPSTEPAAPHPSEPLTYAERARLAAAKQAPTSHAHAHPAPGSSSSSLGSASAPAAHSHKAADAAHAREEKKEFYPVYIRNIPLSISQDALQHELEKHYGPIWRNKGAPGISLRPAERSQWQYAFVDMATREGYEKLLAATLMLGGEKQVLEPRKNAPFSNSRVGKTGQPATSSSGRSDQGRASAGVKEGGAAGKQTQQKTGEQRPAAQTGAKKQAPAK